MERWRAGGGGGGGGRISECQSFHSLKWRLDDTGLEMRVHPPDEIAANEIPWGWQRLQDF